MSASCALATALRTTSYLPWLIPPDVIMMSGLKDSYSAARRCSSSTGSSPIAMRRTVAPSSRSMALSIGPLASKIWPCARSSGEALSSPAVPERISSPPVHTSTRGPAATVKRAYPWEASAPSRAGVTRCPARASTWPVTTSSPRRRTNCPTRPVASLIFSLGRPKDSGRSGYSIRSDCSTGITASYPLGMGAPVIIG